MSLGKNNRVDHTIYYLLKFSFDLTIKWNKIQMQSNDHEKLFGHLRKKTFSAEEAAEYLEISIPTLRRYVQSGKLKPSAVIRRSQLFSTSDLKLLKQKLSK